MTVRTITLKPNNHDGTSQRARALPALDPGYAPIDERTTADWIEFVRELATKLPHFTADKTNNEIEQDGNWSRFVENPALTAAQIVEYISDPSRFNGEQARWLGRPHFALLLTFLELLGHARDQLNGFTRRHLDYFYREVLRMRPLPARPDRVTVFFRLAHRVENCRLPAGTLLDAGRDGNGVPQHYRTEREIVVNRAEIASIRSLYVDRHTATIANVQENKNLNATGVFNQKLALALEDPSFNLDYFRAIEQECHFLDNFPLRRHEIQSLTDLTRSAEQTYGDDARLELVRLLEKVRVPAPEPLTPNAVDAQLDYHLRLSWPGGATSFSTYAQHLCGLESRLCMNVTHIRQVGDFAVNLQGLVTSNNWSELDAILVQAQEKKVLAKQSQNDPKTQPNNLQSRRTEWRNLYAYEDATQCLSDAVASPRWKTFGKVNASDSENPPPLQLGWAIRSPALSLKEGEHELTLTLVLSTSDLTKTKEEVCSEFNDGWLYQASAGPEWIDLQTKTVTPIEEATNGKKRTVTVKIVLVFAEGQGAIWPRSGDVAPTLRALLLQQWDIDRTEWTTLHPAFEALRVECVSVGANPGTSSKPVTFQPDLAIAGHCLLHVHPFGESPLPKACPFLFPRYDNAGELYIGLRNVEPPQNLPLLLQCAEGTSDPDLAPTPVLWDVLDGNTWKRLIVNHDSTYGFLDSGIVELALPTTEPSTILPSDLYWIRASVEQNPAAIADTIGVHAQAVAATFADREDTTAHYASPLAPGKVTRLVKADARVAKIEQPYSSRDGRPPESPDKLNLRVSERLRHRQRALTPWDYERLVLQEFPQIYKAKCIPASMDSPGLVKVIVVPDIRNALPGDAFEPRASARLLAKIQEYLQERAPSTAKIIVKNPKYVPVRVRLAVRFLSGQDEGFAAQRLLQDLNRYLSPWAYDEGADLEIGGRIYANSILGFLDRCDYVDYATRIRLYRNDVPPGTDQVATEESDEVLVSSRGHVIDVISDRTTLTGIGYMRIELDFEVA